MESLSNIKNKKQIVEEFFCWVLDKDNVELFEEVDFTLAPDYYDPNIYYTKEILDFFNTKAMNRIGRVGQLGLMILENKNYYHNRLEHSKGTYNRKLEELIYLASNPQYREYIEKNNLITMGNFLSSLFNRKKETRILLLGLDAAGKRNDWYLSVRPSHG